MRRVNFRQLPKRLMSFSEEYKNCMQFWSQCVHTLGNVRENWCYSYCRRYCLDRTHTVLLRISFKIMIYSFVFQTQIDGCGCRKITQFICRKNVSIMASILLFWTPVSRSGRCNVLCICITRLQRINRNGFRRLTVVRSASVADHSFSTIA